MKKMNKQSGQVLVSMAVAFVVLAGFAGLAMDMGVLRYERRLQQTAADGAAVAGASNLPYGGVGAAAQSAAAQDGFTNNNSDCTSGAIGCVNVSINNPPTYPGGAHVGDIKYVEAVVTAVHQTYFMNLFGVDRRNVVTRAVATNITGGSKAQCMITLGPPTAAIEGVDVQGSAWINAPHCGIADNGNFDTTGNGYRVTANTFAVGGQCLGNDCSNPNTLCTAGAPCPAYQVPATPDPLKNGPTAITPPAFPGYSADCPAVGFCDWASNGNAAHDTIHPGAYNSIAVGANHTVVLMPGIYYINGAVTGDANNPNSGLNMNGKGSIHTQGYLGGANPCGASPATQIAGVMIYFTNTSTINKFVGGGNIPDLQLCPMNATQPENPGGTYTGIQIYQDPNDAATPYLYGDNNSTYNGVLYFPTVKVVLYGNSNFTSNGPLIADAISINGNPVVTLGNFPGGLPPTASFAVPTIVE